MSPIASLVRTCIHSYSPRRIAIKASEGAKSARVLQTFGIRRILLPAVLARLGQTGFYLQPSATNEVCVYKAIMVLSKFQRGKFTKYAVGYTAHVV